MKCSGYATGTKYIKTQGWILILPRVRICLEEDSGIMTIDIIVTLIAKPRMCNFPVFSLMLFFKAILDTFSIKGTRMD